MSRHRRAVLLRGLAVGAALAALWYAVHLSQRLWTHSDVPVTNQIDWGMDQPMPRITGFEITVARTKLNVFHHDAVIRLAIQGELDARYDRWRPVITKVHISERLVQVGEEPVGEFQVTPIVGGRPDDAYAGEKQHFKTTVEYLVHTWKWGPNRYVFKCGQLARELELSNPK